MKQTTKMGSVSSAGGSAAGGGIANAARRGAAWAQARTRALMASAKGQGTTEYAILVGVLVVIAILAIMVFRPRLQELWNAIAEGINGL